MPSQFLSHWRRILKWVSLRASESWGNPTWIGTVVFSSSVFHRQCPKSCAILISGRTYLDSDKQTGWANCRHSFSTSSRLSRMRPTCNPFDSDPWRLPISFYRNHRSSDYSRVLAMCPRYEILWPRNPSSHTCHKDEKLEEHWVV